MSRSAWPGKCVRITRAEGPPIESLLSSSYTTASVNFLTWNKAYSIFPKQTLVEHKLLPLRHLDTDFGSVLQEFSLIGWTNRDILWPEIEGEKGRRIAGGRRVGDASSLVVLLDVGGVRPASTPDFVIEHAQFEVISEFPFQAPRSEIHFPHIKATALLSPALRHGYTTYSSATKSWPSYVTTRLEQWFRVEIYKLDPDRRPRHLQNGIPRYPTQSDRPLLNGYKPPESWDYADDQIPVWYREWEAKTRKETQQWTG